MSRRIAGALLAGGAVALGLVVWVGIVVGDSIAILGQRNRA